MPDQPVLKPEPSGVGGWLAVLVGWLLVINPVMGLGPLLQMFSNMEQADPGLAGSQTWGLSKLVALAGAASGTGLMFFAGVRLIDSKTAKSPAFAVKALWIGNLAIPLGTAVILALLNGNQTPTLTGKAFGGILGGLVWIAIWSLYLTRSKRVKNTYFLGTKG